MAYTFTATQVAVPFVAETASQLPILLNTNKQLDREFKAGTGTTMTMIIPDHPDVTTGPTIDATLLNYTSGNRTLTLVQQKVAIAADQVTRALAIHDFENQVAKPYAAKLASEIQKAAVNVVKLKADNQIVLTGSQLFPQVAKAVAAIRAARSYGSIFGALGEQLSAEVGSSGINYFNPVKDIENIWRDADLGVYQTARWFHSPDVTGLDTGDAAFNAGSQICTVGSQIVTDGTTSLVLNDGGLLGGEIVKAGQGFTVAGVKTVDIYGVSTNMPYGFVAQEDATAGVGTITLKVKPIYFSKPLQNVSGTSIDAGLVVTALQKPSTSYYAGIIWDKMSLAFGSAALAPMSGTDAKNISDPKGLSVTCTKGPDILAGREVVRWDVLTGFELIRTGWAAAVYFEVP